MAKKVVQDHDDELVGQYIRAIENPDSVGWNPAARRWEAPKLRGYDSRNRGMGVDVINNDAAKQLTDGRKGRYLTEAEERELRNGHIDYSQTIVNKWTPRSVLISPPSEAKRAMAAGMAYRGDNIYWNIVKNPAMSAVYYGGSDADFQKAVSEFYKSKGVFERAKNHDAFFGTDDSEEGQALSEFVRGLIDNGDRWEPPVNRHDDGGSMNKGWNNLTMSQRSEMMRWFLSKGVNSLDEMRRMYNEEVGSVSMSQSDMAQNTRSWGNENGGYTGNRYGDGGNVHEERVDALQVVPNVSPFPIRPNLTRESAVGRAERVYSNYEDAKDDDMNPWNLQARKAARYVKDNYVDWFPSGLSNCTLTATQWVDPTNPVKNARSIVGNPQQYGYAPVDSSYTLPGDLLIAKHPTEDSYHTMLIEGFADKDGVFDFDGTNYPYKQGEPLLRYSRGGHDNSFIRRGIPLSVYTANSDGKTENHYYRYNYPNETFLKEVVVTPKK